MRTWPKHRLRGGVRRRRSVVALVAALSVAGLCLFLVAPNSASERVGGPTVGDDPVQRRTLTHLTVFTQWLQVNDARGYIGEVGIPADGDDRWLELARKWFQVADRADLWVDAWSVGEWWRGDYIYSPFVIRGERGPVSAARPTGAFLSAEARRSDEPRGVNVSGGEFGAPGGRDRTSPFSNENSGEYGHDYSYDSQGTFDYLAAQGMDTVRLPFRWERIQPRLSAPLDRDELARLRDAVQRAHAAGLEVILDVHNFGAYYLDDDGIGVRREIGSQELPAHHLTDLWLRLSAAFDDEPGVVAYDLMNEPVNLPSVGELAPAQLWEAATQDVVDAIRARGDQTLIMVPGYSWSHVGEWAVQHPRAWIRDPADNFRYTAHQYWLSSEDGSYDSEVANAVASGY